MPENILFSTWKSPKLCLLLRSLNFHLKFRDRNGFKIWIRERRATPMARAMPCRTGSQSLYLPLLSRKVVVRYSVVPVEFSCSSMLPAGPYKRPKSELWGSIAHDLTPPDELAIHIPTTSRGRNLARLTPVPKKKVKKKEKKNENHKNLYIFGKIAKEKSCYQLDPI